MTAKQYFDAYAQFAINAGERFNVNPAVILAISSYETGYASSYSARNDKNFFGLSASSYFNSEFWNGTDKRATTDSAGSFRVYTSVQNSFYDFAWLLSTASRYKSAFNASYNITLFADEFAKSGYFTGNQANYKNAIISRSKTFLTYLKDISAVVTGTGSGGTGTGSGGTGSSSSNAIAWAVGLLGLGALLKKRNS